MEEGRVTHLCLEVKVDLWFLFFLNTVKDSFVGIKKKIPNAHCVNSFSFSPFSNVVWVLMPIRRLGFLLDRCSGPSPDGNVH